jgi:hypothetical protein
VAEAPAIVNRCRCPGWDNVATGAEAPVKYLILIYSNPRSRQVFESLPPEQRAEGYRAYAALDEELAASGELIVSEALADPSLARRVTVRAGRTITSDGPFAEVKEHLAGLYLVECDSLDRAVQIAARVPAAEDLEIEVRPVLELDGPDLEL